MPVITETFTSGQTKRYSYRGGFFRLLECSLDLPVNIDIQDTESGSAETLDNVKAGIAITMPIDSVRITAKGGAQTIKFFVGNSRVEYDREAKNVLVENTYFSSDTSSFNTLAIPQYGGIVVIRYRFKGTYTGIGTRTVGLYARDSFNNYLPYVLIEKTFPATGVSTDVDISGEISIAPATYIAAMGGGAYSDGTFRYRVENALDSNKFSNIFFSEKR